jgi:hypothetical protein
MDGANATLDDLVEGKLTRTLKFKDFVQAFGFHGLGGPCCREDEPPS